MANSFSTWLSTNKVLIFGLASAIIMDVQQYLTGTPDWKIVGLSAGVVATSFLAKNLRGQWVTILGSIGTMLTAVITSITTHTPMTWGLTLTTFILGIIAAVSPAGKSLSYEQSTNVEAAKAQAKAIDSAKNPPVNPPVETNTPQSPKKP